jgi:preprotein translocase subunit SecA
MILESIENEIERVAYFHTGGDDVTLWDLEEISKSVNALLPAEFNSDNLMQEAEKRLADEKVDIINKRTQIIESLMELARSAYAKIEESVADPAMMGELEKGILLRAYDMLWVDHLEAIDHLRRGIGLQGYAQHDPLVEYKREAYRMFNELNTLISKQVAQAIFKIPTAQRTALQFFKPRSGGQPLIFSGAAKTSDQISSSAPEQSSANDPRFKDAGRNDPCPCGSGKKFKKCHGA